MARISVTEVRSVDLPSVPSRVYAFFANPGELLQAVGRLQRCELLPDGRVRWVRTESAGRGISFQPDYVVTYDSDGQRTVSWTSIDGNMACHGQVEVCEGPNGSCTVRYRETIAPDLPVSDRVAKLLRPSVARQLRESLDEMFCRVEDLLAN